MRYADASECPATIVRSIETGVEYVNLVGIFRIGIDARVVPGALTQVALLVGLCPGLAAIVRTKDAAIFGFDNRPQSIRIRGRHSDAHNSNRPTRQTRVARDFRPSVATVS